MNNTIEKAYKAMCDKAYVKKQDIDQHTLVLNIMREGYLKKKKIWWFAYELMGFHNIDGKRYFMSYKASTRVCELAFEGKIESRGTNSKLHVYASCEILDLIN